MVNLIDKDAVIAEIERRRKLVSDPILSGNDLMIGERNALFNLLPFINTLEVKEVDLTEEIYFYIENSITGTNPIYTKGAVSNLIEKAAKHFFELGLKVKQN